MAQNYHQPPNLFRLPVAQTAAAIARRRELHGGHAPRCPCETKRHSHCKIHTLKHLVGCRFHNPLLPTQTELLRGMGRQFYHGAGENNESDGEVEPTSNRTLGELLNDRDTRPRKVNPARDAGVRGRQANRDLAGSSRRASTPPPPPTRAQNRPAPPTSATSKKQPPPPPSLKKPPPAPPPSPASKKPAFLHTGGNRRPGSYAHELIYGHRNTTSAPPPQPPSKPAAKAAAGQASTSNNNNNPAPIQITRTPNRATPTVAQEREREREKQKRRKEEDRRRESEQEKRSQEADAKIGNRNYSVAQLMNIVFKNQDKDKVHGPNAIMKVAHAAADHVITREESYRLEAFINQRDLQRSQK